MKKIVHVCQGVSCKARSRDLYSIAEQAAEEFCSEVEVRACNCTGNCANGPTVIEEVDGKTTVNNMINTQTIVDLIKQLTHATK